MSRGRATCITRSTSQYHSPLSPLRWPQSELTRSLRSIRQCVTESCVSRGRVFGSGLGPVTLCGSSLYRTKSVVASSARSHNAPIHAKLTTLARTTPRKALRATVYLDLRLCYSETFTPCTVSHLESVAWRWIM